MWSVEYRCEECDYYLDRTARKEGCPQCKMIQELRDRIKHLESLLSKESDEKR